MHESLQDELKAFEKELSILLVRFMKICDKVEREQGRTPESAQAKAPTGPTLPKQRPVDLRAYV